MDMQRSRSRSSSRSEWRLGVVVAMRMPSYPSLLFFSLLLISVNFDGVEVECAQLKSHYTQFIKAKYRGINSNLVGCAANVSVCSDPVKNPDATNTFVCCFNTFCRDLSSDSSHCGMCDKSCTYGFACCAGFCVDITNDRNHCGSCYYQCPPNVTCSYGLCGYS